MIKNLKEELENLYDLNIEKVEEVRRKQKGRLSCYKIIAKEGIFFLKTYDERINSRIIRSFELLEYLVSKGYPAIKPFRSKRGNWIEVVNNIPVALFEWVNGERVRNPKEKHAYELGKYLALLHKLTKDYKFPESDRDSTTVRESLIGLIYHKIILKDRMPDKYLRILEKLIDILSNWKIPSNVPKSIIHGEFTFVHVLFKNREVYRIIDWDEVTRSWSFQDLGLPLYDLWSTDMNLAKAFLEGYNKIRPLTSWERENLNKILLFGAAVSLWWTICEVKDGILDWEDIDINLVEEIVEGDIKLDSNFL